MRWKHIFDKQLNLQLKGLMKPGVTNKLFYFNMLYITFRKLIYSCVNFQSPYYWPWQNRPPDNVEYAIYLAKRTLRNKQRHGLEDYELEALGNLRKNLANKWDFITMQAEEQVPNNNLLKASRF